MSELPSREFFIDNLLVRLHLITKKIQRTGLAPWVLECLFPGSLTSTYVTPPFNPAFVEVGSWGLAVTVLGLRFRVWD